ncbi:MAG TPA: aminotransferase class IV [Methylomirabilota bacterium]|nr:aminotransferase class IV [Methylomirabilota bacterium]
MSERSLYLNGKLVPYSEATIHVHSNAVKYGTSVFEGLRAYWNEKQQELYVFRLEEHISRLLDSLKLMRMEHSLTRDELRHSVLDTLRKNEFREDVHIRQTAYVMADDNVEARGPVGLAVDGRSRRMAAKRALDICVSSWMRIPDGAMPPRIKCSANYQNGRLAQLEALANGYDYVVLPNSRGKIAEAPGACFFLVRGGAPMTPPVTADVLESITRATVIQLLRERHRLAPIEREIDRTELYVGDEAFLCGTAWEVTAIASVDRLPLAVPAPGPLTQAVADTYQRAVRGELTEYRAWLTPVYGTR